MLLRPSLPSALCVVDGKTVLTSISYTRTQLCILPFSRGTHVKDAILSLEIQIAVPKNIFFRDLKDF